MNPQNDITDALIVRFLSGQATPEEAIEINSWIEASELHAAHFEALAQTYALTHGLPVFRKTDTITAWKKVNEKTKVAKASVKLVIHKYYFLMAAASVAVLLFAAGAWVNHYLNNPNDNTSEGLAHGNYKPLTNKTLTATSSDRHYTLADNSRVTLHAGSILTLSEGFNNTDRRLLLKGSGTFEVVHNAQKPFIIDVGGLEVIDIGTVFSISTLSDTVKVVVAEGAVELRINDASMLVEQGDSAFYLVSRDVIKRYQKPENRKDKIFVFEGTRLKDAVDILGAFFGRKIVVMDKAIEDCRLSVTFKNEELATILDIIKELLDVKIIQNDEIIGIYGESCQ